MGYYIQVPENLNKASQIAKLHGGIVTSRPRSLASLPPGKALICIISRGPFEAAGFCYSEKEFEEFHRKEDTSPRSYVLLDWDKACELTGYKKEG
jgi:hypothetical protein